MCRFATCSGDVSFCALHTYGLGLPNCIGEGPSLRSLVSFAVFNVHVCPEESSTLYLGCMYELNFVMVQPYRLG